MRRVAIVAVALLVATGLFILKLGSHNAAQATLTKTVAIDTAGRDHFAPAPADAQPALTADQAIAEFAKQDSEFVLPKDATVTLGLYTASRGDGTYSFENELAYGLNYALCIPPQHDVGSNYQVSCNFWLFLDANTGQMLQGEEGQVPAAGS